MRITCGGAGTPRHVVFRTLDYPLWSMSGHNPVRQLREDMIDAEAIYSSLENQIVPLYYDRDRAGVPHGWIRLIKESISSIVPRFCARRMMKEYIELYLTLTEERIKA